MGARRSSNTRSCHLLATREQRQGTQPILEFDVLTLKHRLFEGGWSREVERELFVRPAAVAVLPYDPERGRVVLVEQFRVGALDDSAALGIDPPTPLRNSDGEEVEFKDRLGTLPLFARSE